MKIAYIMLMSVFLLTSCSSTPDADEQKSTEGNSIGKASVETAEVAAKPVTTTADVVFDSVVGVNFLMNDLMKKINSMIPSPVEENSDSDE